MTHDTASSGPKPRPNDRRYIEVLRSMTPADRLRKAFELTELSRRLFRLGLKRRFPNLSERELHCLFLERYFPDVGLTKEDWQRLLADAEPVE